VIGRILVIKLGALGDFVQATGPMKAIRAHHRDARITLLTTPPLAELAEACPFVDEVWYDERPPAWRLDALLALRRRLRGARFARVYDLQTSDRSGWYFRLLLPDPPEWSGIVAGASHPHRNPERDRMHTLDRQAEQLAAAGIKEVPAPDVSWAAADVGRFGLARPYVLLVPGGSAHRPQKRWPAARYAALAAALVGAGIEPVLIGGPAERGLAGEIAPAHDLVGRTSLRDIVGLARGALRTIGNDTGPVHLAVAAGSPATVLYSAASDPALTAPRGAEVAILRRDPLAALGVEEVAATVLRDAASRSRRR
jgi:ADP-heptose:LPS heptosyltransferase